NAFFDMTDVGGTSDETGKLDDRSQGSAVGLELMLRRPMTKKLGGFVSYTLSQSLRSIGRSEFPSQFDRTHVANLALGYDLGRRWRAGTRIVFYSGVPKFVASGGL